MAEDLKTSLPFHPCRVFGRAWRLLRCAGANDVEMAEFEKHIKSWSHGSCWISDLTPIGAHLLKIDTRRMIAMAQKNHG